MAICAFSLAERFSAGFGGVNGAPAPLFERSGPCLDAAQTGLTPEPSDLDNLSSHCAEALKETRACPSLPIEFRQDRGSKCDHFMMA